MALFEKAWFLWYNILDCAPNGEHILRGWNVAAGQVNVSNNKTRH